MRGLADTAAKYRWELLLFIGLPLLSDAAAFEVLTFPIRVVLLIVRTTGLLIPIPSIDTFGAFSLHVHAFLLGIFYYFHVRRSGRRTLSLVWAYAFAATAIGAVAAWAPDLDSPWEWLTPGAEALAGGVVLVWFATRASRFSLGHAFLLIGLSTALHGYGTVAIYLSVPWTEGNPTYWLVSPLTIAHGLLAVWALARFDSTRTLSWKLDHRPVRAGRRAANCPGHRKGRGPRGAGSAIGSCDACILGRLVRRGHPADLRGAVSSAVRPCT